MKELLYHESDVAKRRWCSVPRLQLLLAADTLFLCYDHLTEIKYHHDAFEPLQLHRSQRENGGCIRLSPEGHLDRTGGAEMTWRWKKTPPRRQNGISPAETVVRTRDEKMLPLGFLSG